jgi:cyclopropane fatty-acyl-phospholipid synthase-like methyltransferase
MTDAEEYVADYYEGIWRHFVRWWRADKTLGLHWAFYEKGIKNFEEAILNLNIFVGKLLDLNEKTSMEILDAGCGVGGTSIYLAKKYKNINFTGVTITPGQIELAKKFAKERNAENTTFLLKNYIDTGYPDNFFNGAFAIESASYAPDKRAFIDEMHRIIKSNGRIAVIGAFYTDVNLNYFMKKIYDYLRKGRGVPPNADLSLKSFKKDLTDGGFKDIVVKDITKNVARSQMRSFIIGIPFLIISMLKYVIKFGKYKPEKDPDFYVGASVISTIFGASGSARYYAITAVRD